MTNGQELFIIILGLWMAIFFKSNGKNIVKGREELSSMVTFGKYKVNIAKSEVRITQIGSLVIGIIFVIVGLVEFFK